MTLSEDEINQLIVSQGLMCKQGSLYKWVDGDTSTTTTNSGSTTTLESLVRELIAEIRLEGSYQSMYIEVPANQIGYEIILSPPARSLEIKADQTIYISLNTKSNPEIRLIKDRDPFMISGLPSNAGISRIFVDNQAAVATTVEVLALS